MNKAYLRAICLSAILGSSLVWTAQAAPLVLAKDGAARAVILTPGNPTRLEAFAAKHLAECLGKMTGGTFRVEQEAGNLRKPPAPPLSGGKVVISIGRTALAKGIAIQGAEWKRGNPEAFRVVRRGNALVICGNPNGKTSDYGALWGVHAFLEKQGVGFFYPDPLGDVIPRKPTLSVGDLDFSDAPWLEMRGGGNPVAQLKRYEPGGDLAGKWPPEGRDYELKSGVTGGTHKVEFYHMYDRVITPQVRKDHPEWFANAPGPYGICLTNPGIRNLFIEYLKNRFREDPDLWGATICPDDHALGDRCTCPDCQRLMAMSAPPTFTHDSPRSSSDLQIDFVNAVAKGLEKEFPDRRLITYAYLDYIDPPTKIRVHPNVIIMIAPLRSPDELNPALDRIVQGWKNMGTQKLYWYGYILTRPPIPNLMGEWFRKYKRLGIDGVYLEFAHGTLAFTGLSSWLTDKLMWDPDADVGALVNHYCNMLYGPKAGPFMSRVFLAWETRPPFADTDIPLALKSAQEAAGDPASITAKRVRLVKLAYDLWHSAYDLDTALKLNDIPEASRIVKGGIGDAEAIRSEYPAELFLKQDVAIYNRVGWCEYIACVKDSLNNLLTSTVTRPAPEPTAPGPAMCLTNNADIPQAQRIESGVKASFAPSVGAESEGAKLFDGAVTGPEHSIYTGNFANLIIDLDMQRKYQIDRVEVCTGTNVGESCLISFRAVPIYIEVQVSDDGKEFKAVDRILPRTLPGFVSSDSLMVSARYVKLVVYGLNYSHDIGEVRIWGRPK